MLFDPSKAKPIVQFKTPEQLRLSQKQYDALLKTLAYLEDGKIRAFVDDEVPWGNPPKKASLGDARFNMSVWTASYVDCGTICCIGGLTDLLARENLGLRDIAWTGDLVTEHRKTAIGNLFYPNEKGYHATPQQAAVALRNYLTTGHPRWREVMRKKSAP